jgi:hypothetical protein
MITASVVVFHTKRSDIDRLLKCVEKSPIEYLYVIDNSSNDELREHFSQKQYVRYIHSINLGYGAGHNIAINQAISLGAKFHVVINPDIYWTDNVIDALADYMDNDKDCGLVMPKILYPNGETQYLCKKLPTPMDLIIRRFIPSKSYKNCRDYDYELRWSGYNKLMEVPSLSGCFMFMRCSILEQVKGFDERYFMYAEDLDLCRRIGELSKTVYYPFVSVVHEYEKGSYKNGKLLRYHIASIIKYFNKWGWLCDKQRTRINKKLNLLKYDICE